MNIIIEKFKSFSKKISDIQAFIILSVFFFILIPIFSLILKTKRKEIEEELSWKKWSTPSDTIAQVKNQY